MSSFDLKIFAIISMFIDHLGNVFFPEQLLFRAIGRISFPIFAFQTGIGFKHTKSKEKHILLLLLFALISQIPFLFVTNIHASNSSLNIFFTFAFALTIIYSLEKIKHYVIKIPLALIIFLIAFLLKVDYGVLGILLTVCLYFFNNNKIGTLFIIFAFTILHYLLKGVPLQILGIFSLIFILNFNGKKGPNAKWLFYIFYPLHMLILFICYKLFS